MAGAAEGFSAQEHGSRLSRTVELGRDVGAHPSRALCGQCARAKAARPAPPPPSSTARAPRERSKGGLCSILQATTRARRSRAARGTSSSIRSALLLSVAVHSADIQDRDGAALVLDKRTRRSFPFIERIFARIFADGGYNAKKTADAVAATGTWVIEIVKRSEPTASWSSQNAGSLNAPWPGSAATDAWRGDFERYATTVAAFVPPRHDPHHA